MPTRTIAPEAEVLTPGPTNQRRWLILVIVALAQLTIVLDATIVNIALPSAQQDLGFSNDNRQWLITAYSLAFGSLLLLGGRIADLFGRKATFITGLVGFAAASALGGAAANFEVLVTARALQGVFGALLAPAALSLLTTTFTDAKERARAFGVFGAVAGAGGGVGLLLGGVLTEHLDWRWTMYVNLGFAAVAVTGAALLLGKQVPAVSRPKLDIPGTVAVSAGLFAIVFGFANAETASWGDARTWGGLIAGALLLAVFVAIQNRATHPLLPMRVLTDRDRAASYIGVGVVGAGMFGVFLFLTYYMQQSLGYSPIQTGLAFLPMIGGVMAGSLAATSVLAPRIGPKRVVPAGMALAAGSLVWMTGLGMDSSYAAHIMPALFAFGTGAGLIIGPAMSGGTAGVRSDDAGVASAMVNTTQQIGGSVGTALLSTLSASAATNYLDGKAASPAAIAQSALEGYSTAYWWSAAIFAGGFVLTGLLYRTGVPRADLNAAPAVHM
ncbi:MFS transporter [Streptomyces sp. NPDC051572]|uniref:MFS transporter n=1 Tax=unclassified Streptomyces TaxID=2593676 RepID=UPI00344DA459